MNINHFKDLPTTPWKNGGGATREIACYPQGAGLDDFLWRISIADVATSGPFSIFSGIDRIIALLDGDGMQLNFTDGRVHALTTVLAPYRFRGEDELHAELVGSPSQDFNLMLRRDAADGDVNIWREATCFDCAQGFLTFFCTSGRWEIILPDGARHEIGRRHILSGACAVGNLTIAPLEANSALLGVSVTLRKQKENHDIK